MPMLTKNKKKLLFGSILIVLVIYLGFVRDSLFININYIIDELYFNQEVFHYHTMYRFLVPLGVEGLMRLKWILTFVFMLLNYGLSLLILKQLLLDSGKVMKLLSWGYVVLFVISGILFILSKLLGFSELGYTLARRFMGVLQSPVPLMLVFSVHLMFFNINSKKP